MSGNFLVLIYICNFHVLNYLLLTYIRKLHWNQGIGPQLTATFEMVARDADAVLDKSNISRKIAMMPSLLMEKIDNIRGAGIYSSNDNPSVSSTDVNVSPTVTRYSSSPPLK